LAAPVSRMTPASLRDVARVLGSGAAFQTNLLWGIINELFLGKV